MNNPQTNGDKGNPPFPQPPVILARHVQVAQDVLAPISPVIFEPGCKLVCRLKVIKRSGWPIAFFPIINAWMLGFQATFETGPTTQTSQLLIFFVCTTKPQEFLFDKQLSNQIYLSCFSLLACCLFWGVPWEERFGIYVWKPDGPRFSKTITCRKHNWYVTTLHSILQFEHVSLWN